MPLVEEQDQRRDIPLRKLIFGTHLASNNKPASASAGDAARQEQSNESWLGIICLHAAAIQRVNKVLAFSHQ